MNLRAPDILPHHHQCQYGKLNNRTEMLSRISQIGKNLTDELAKNLEEAPRARGSGEADIYMNNNDEEGVDNDAYVDLPAELKAKLRKFAKYEQKYPQLLDAYKTMKAQVAKFEKVLQESTPCSGIHEGEQLAEYLNSLTLKNTMLTDEMRKMSKDTSKDDKVKELEFKVTELKKQLGEKSPVETTNYSSVDGANIEDTCSQINDLASPPHTGLREKDELKEQVGTLRSDITTLESSIQDSEAQINKLKSENEELTVKLEKSQDSLSVTISEAEGIKNDLASSQSEVESLKTQLQDSNRSIKDLNSTKRELEDIEKQLNSAKEELESAKSEVAVLTKRLADVENPEKSGNLEKEELNGLKKANDMNAADLQASLDSKTKELEEILKSFESSLSEKDATIKKLEQEQRSRSPVSSVGTSEDQTPASAASKKNKKKKKKSKINTQPEAAIKDSEQLTVEDDMGDELTTFKAKYETLQLSFKEFRNSKSLELKSKVEEIENLRDMLKDVGDDLVTTRDELKDLGIKYRELQKFHQETEALEANSKDAAKLSQEQKVELEVLPNQHEESITDYEKEKSENAKLVSILEEEKKVLSEKIESLTIDLGLLKEKINDIDGNESSLATELEDSKRLVCEKDSKIKELSSIVTDLENSLKTAREESKKHLAEVNSLSRVKSTLEKDIQGVQAERSKLIEQNRKLEHDLVEFTNLKKSETSLKKELTQVQATLSHRDKTILYFEKQVKDYEVLKANLMEEVAKFKGSTRELNIQANSLNDQLSRMSREKSKLNEELIDIQQKHQIALDENKSLLDKHTILQEKFEDFQNTKSTSNEQIESIKKQCEELNVSYKEAQRRCEELEDELSENRALLQERTREASTIRRLLLEKEETQDSRVDELASKLRTAFEEKDRIQSDNAIALSKKQRELDETLLKNNELEKLVREWTAKESLLQGEIHQLKSAKNDLEKQSQQSNTSSDELSGVISKMRDSLSVSEKKVREYENLNHVLKKLNEELSAKMDRLSKNYKLLSSQLKEQKQKSTQGTPSGSPISSRSNSIISNMHLENGFSSSPVGNSNNDTTDKIAYLRNVLLGFLDHREQRQQLLPVISMLLQLDKADEKRLLLSLK